MNFYALGQRIAENINDMYVTNLKHILVETAREFELGLKGERFLSKEEADLLKSDPIAFNKLKGLE